MRPMLAVSVIIISFPTLRITCLLQYTPYACRILALSTSVSDVLDRTTKHKMHPMRKLKSRTSKTSRYLGFYRQEKREKNNKNINPSCPEQSTTSALLVERERHKRKVRIPPWIPKYVSSSDGIDSSHFAKHSLVKLQVELENHVKRIQSTGDFFSNTHSYDVIKDPSDIAEIINAVVTAGGQSQRLISGAAEFLCLLLSIDEVSSQERKISYASYSLEFPFNPTNRLSVVSKHSMIAASFHYVDCVVAREGGVYEIVRETMRGTKPSEIALITGSYYLLPSVSNSKEMSTNEGESESTIITKGINRFDRKRRLVDDVVGIMEAAAKIKQVEIFADAIKSDTSSSVAHPSHKEAESIRGMLLSATEDWRSLMIRCVASLYRLRGISNHQFSMTSSLSSTSHADIIRVAREALHVYAPLAQRLGLYRLKNEIENRSFSILYKRQFHIAQSLFARQGASLESVADFVSDRISQTLLNDVFLSEKLEFFRVESRVKQPYSLWKKLIRQRLRNTDRPWTRTVVPSKLSVTDILDSIALRVVLRPKALDDLDHEKMLCYYALKILRNVFQVNDTKRIKDYISTPKSNGYMSIHFTSSINRYSQDWPFEVQIRTEDMHHKAEYGPAAHWDYKLRSTGPTDTSIPVTSAIVKNFRSSTGSAYIDSFLSSRDSIALNEIFIFVSPSDSALEGRIISIPKDSNLYDALLETSKLFDIDSSLSHNNGILLNGNRIETWNSTLNNGDILTLPLLQVKVKQ
jgi:ppGpp synthetase/RelA/SpoT-type nucleotidyltranferase